MSNFLKKIQSSMKDVYQSDEGATVSVLKDSRIVISGCRRISEYRDDLIVVSADMEITVSGKGLVLREVGNNNIIVSGELNSVSFKRGEE